MQQYVVPAEREGAGEFVNERPVVPAAVRDLALDLVTTARRVSMLTMPGITPIKVDEARAAFATLENLMVEMRVALDKMVGVS